MKPFVLLTTLLWAVSIAAQTSEPEKSFQQAAAAQQRGDDETAVRIYRELLRTHPESVVVRANLGASLDHLKRFDEAIEQYRQVLVADPHNLPVRVNLALAYQEKGDLHRAVDQLEIVHKADPDNLQAAMLLSSCYFQLGSYAQTISILSPLESKLPDDLDLKWLLGSALIETARAEEGLRRIDEVAEKAQSADAYLLAGQARLEREEYGEARRDADTAARLNPSLDGVQTLNGMILERTGEYEAAEAALQLSVKANADDFDAHYYLGAILYFKRDLQGARTQLEKALLLRPESGEARYELALVARAEGKYEEARKELEAVVRAKPKWIQPHIELSALYYQLKLPQDGARERQIVDRLEAPTPDKSPLSTP